LSPGARQKVRYVSTKGAILQFYITQVIPQGPAVAMAEAKCCSDLGASASLNIETNPRC
jgi:hypothetical protein